MRYPARPDQKRRYLRRLAISLFGFSALLILIFGGVVVNRSIRTLKDDYASFSRQLLGSVSLSSEARYRSAMSLVIGALWRRGTLSSFMYAREHDAFEEQKALNELRLQMAHSDAIHSVYLYNRRTGVFSSVEPVYAEHGPAEATYLRYLSDGFSGFTRAIALSAYESEARVDSLQLISIIAKDVWWADPAVDRAIIVNMSEDAFLGSTEGSESDPGGRLFVVGRDGVVLASSDQTHFGSDFSAYEAVRRAMESSSVAGTFESGRDDFLDDSTYFVSYTRNATLGWTFLHATDSRRLRAEYYGALTSTLWILLPILGLGILLAFGLARRLYHPIENIVSRIQRAHPGVDVHERALDDLDYIDATIDEMATEIRSLSDAAVHQTDAEISQLAHGALTGTITAAESEQLADYIGQRFPSFPVVVGTVALDIQDYHGQVPPAAKPTQLDHLRFLSTIRAWSADYEAAIVLEHQPQHARVVFPLAKGAAAASFRSALEEVLGALNSGAGGSYSAALSEPVDSVEDLHEAAEMTDDLLRYRRLLGRRRLLSPRDIELTGTSDFSYPVELEHRMVAAVRSGRRGEFDAATEELFGYLQGYDVEIFEYAATQVLLNVIREMNDVLRRGKASTLVGYDEVSRLALAMGVPEHVERYRSVFDLFAEKYEAISRRKSSRSELTVSEVRRIVDEHVSDHNLDLTLIAGELNLSPNYLSRLFKDETGQNLTTYIRDARMEQACTLLISHPDLSIADIAARCGYADVNYFSYSFRTCMGVAPSVYRSNRVVEVE